MPTNLLVELVDYALCPLQMQVFALQRPVDVGELNAHLTHQQPVVLVGPVDTRGRVVAHLPSQQADNRLIRLARSNMSAAAWWRTIHADIM